MSKSSEKLYKKREKRINNAIGLKKPYRVRVPIMVLFNFFLAWHSCMTPISLLETVTPEYGTVSLW